MTYAASKVHRASVSGQGRRTIACARARGPIYVRMRTAN